MVDTTDPLQLLPSEVVLHILDFASIDSLARLTRLSRPWHKFIEDSHQDAIYIPRTNPPPGAKDLSFLSDATCFSKYFNDVSSWKDLCRRQVLLSRNWAREQPITRESTIQIGNEPIWRFKPDFKRRLILSTSQLGGFNVIDMDDGRLLWRLADDIVRPFAHLEYQDGTAVWDRGGNAVEVWRTDHELGMARGEFKNVAVLPHNFQTRGFQLSYNTLCVVSSEGRGFVYKDVATGVPNLQTEIQIEAGAVGHLDQGPDAVAYSIGQKGYHIYDKTSGQYLGVLQPKASEKLYHVTHETRATGSDLRSEGSLADLATAFPPKNPRNDRTSRLTIHDGAMPLPDGEFLTLSEDEWGAGMLSGDLFVGISRGGRVFVCSDWRKAVQSQQEFSAESAIIECDSDGSTFDLGGWLSVRDHRIMFEIQDRIHVIGLSDQDRVIPTAAGPSRPSWTFASCLSSQLAVPVSFMAIYDDCIMATYTTLRHRARARQGNNGLQPRRGVLPTKVIRILSLAPDLNGNDDKLVAAQAARQDESQLPPDMLLREDMYQLIEMLVGDEEDEDEDVEAALDLMEGQAGGGDLDDID